MTFLFTDLEASTRFWERRPEEMPAVYARHDEILRAAIGHHGGIVYKVIGDAFQAAFPNAMGALAAAVEAQRALLGERWPIAPAPRVRMALHQVDVTPEPDGDYRTPGLNRLGRLLVAADGSQILLSEALAGGLTGAQIEDLEIVDLGVHRFRDLSPQRVYQVLAPGLPSTKAALRALTPHRHNLPQPPTTFIGRSDDVERGVAALLDPSGRALTLLGTGGIGKTRLAIEIASRLVDEFADGVWFVPLAAISDPGLVLPAIAEVLAVRESVDQTVDDALVAHLSEQNTLLVLDNVEQVPGAAPRIGALLATCPRLKLLVTSRAPLSIAGEREFPVPPLSLPHAVGSRSTAQIGDQAFDNDAVRLFADRTRAIYPSFAVTSENFAAVVAICARLDGLPLAIELAAARGRLLPPAKLLARLESRLPLLTSASRDMPARQQTLRATIAWSYDLLDPAEKRLFERFAVFAGGATLEAIEAVCGHDGPEELQQDGILDTAESLARQSLLLLEDPTGFGRLRMLETIREFAIERLLASGVASEIAERHATYFLTLAEHAEPRLSGPEQAVWLGALALEHDNLRAALTHLETNSRFTELARLTGALWRFWWIRGHLSEGRDWLGRAIDATAGSTAPAPVRARVFDGAGALAEAQGDIERAIEQHERAIELWKVAGDSLGQARSLENLGIIALHDRGEIAKARELHESALTLYRAASNRHGIASSLRNLGDASLSEEDYPAASTYYAQTLAIARELNDTHAIAAALTSLGALAFFLGEAERAVGLYEECLPHWRALDDLPGMALALGNLGEALDHLGDFSRARPLYEECLTLSRDLGDQQGIAFALSHLGRISRQLGDSTVAARAYSESAEISHKIGDQARLAESIEGLAGVLADSGEAATAARLYGLANSIRQSTKSPLRAVHLREHERNVAAVRAVLGKEEFASLFAAGSLENLDEVSLRLAAIGTVALP